MPAAITIDQAGLPAGVSGQARTDGLSTGALVTLTSSGIATTHRFEFLWVPLDDTTAVASLVATGSPNVWTFTPSGRGSYRVRLVADDGLPSEDEQIRIFGIRLSNGTLVPALNEQADPRSSLLSPGPARIAASENNEPVAGTVLSAGSYAGWHPALREALIASDAGGLLLDTTHNPLLLYQLNGDLTDIGSIGDDLTVGAGVQKHVAGPVGATQALWCTSVADRFVGSIPAPAAARLLGDMTVEVVVFLTRETLDTFGSHFFTHTGGGGGPPDSDNSLWTLQAEIVGGDIRPVFAWQATGGAGQLVQDNDVVIHPGRWYHIVGVRHTASTAGDLWINGEKIASVTGLTAPAGGSASEIHIGADSLSNRGLNHAAVSCAKLISGALTDEQVLAEFDRLSLR